MTIDIGNGFEILTRNEWGATLSPGKDRTSDIIEAWMHHSVTIVDGPTTKDVVADMKEIERVGADRFECFPYSFCYHPGAKILAEGAGWDFRGAHTEDHNNIGIGVAWIGNTSVDPMSEVDFECMGQLLKYGMRIKKLNSTIKYPTGGHRDLKPTNCPGDQLYANLNKIQYYAYCPDNTAPPKPIDRSRQKVIAHDVRANGDHYEVMVGSNGHAFFRRDPSWSALRDKVCKDLGGGLKSIECFFVGDTFFVVQGQGNDNKVWYRSLDLALDAWGTWYQGDNATLLN